jgi:predicted small lipoprotein YifL
MKALSVSTIGRVLRSSPRVRDFLPRARRIAIATLLAAALAACGIKGPLKAPPGAKAPPPPPGVELPSSGTSE